MSKLQNEDSVKEQYDTSEHLKKRISIHELYSTNKQGFGNWIFSNYDIRKASTILELGCGTGEMWIDHVHDLSSDTTLVLSDYSTGMLETTKQNIGEVSNITYRVINIQDIPYEDASFDIVIANMMLYHVPDIKKALQEVHRVLKPSGKLYCATYGEQGIMEHVVYLMKDYVQVEKAQHAFTLQNGQAQLHQFFQSVQRLDYEDALDVRDVNDLIDYINSLTNMTAFHMLNRSILKEGLEKHMKHGVLHVPKEYGMFVCEK